jgi:hypothetical protein
LRKPEEIRHLRLLLPAYSIYLPFILLLTQDVPLLTSQPAPSSFISKVSASGVRLQRNLSIQEPQLDLCDACRMPATKVSCWNRELHTAEGASVSRSACRACLELFRTHVVTTSGCTFPTLSLGGQLVALEYINAVGMCEFIIIFAEAAIPIRTRRLLTARVY